MKRYIFILAIVLISNVLISNVLISEQIPIKQPLEVKDEKDKGVYLTAEQIIIEVKDEMGEGIYSSIYCNDVLCNDEKNFQGKTDSEGILILRGDDKCKDKDKLTARPENRMYTKATEECNTKLERITIKVTSIATMESLREKMEKNLMAGNYATAALASTELAARTDNPEKAQEVAIIAFESFAKYIKFPSDVPVWVYDPLQEKKVLSDEMVKATEQFQVDKGLPKTGKIDYKTLSIAAGIEVSEILFDPVHKQMR